MKSVYILAELGIIGRIMQTIYGLSVGRIMCATLFAFFGCMVVLGCLSELILAGKPVRDLRRCRTSFEGGNFTLPENLHLTLAFLGDCNDADR